MNRLAKQILFGGIFASIFILVGWWAFRLFVPAPTCTDGVQNGREEGLDCGAVCGKSCPPAVRPLENRPVQLIRNADGSWDAVARLDNPNGTYGAARVDYRLVVLDPTGAQLVVSNGRTYVNPAQPRYLVKPLGKLGAVPASAELQFNPAAVQWAALTVDAVGTVEFVVRGDRLTPSAGGLRYEAGAINRSRFDFDEADAVVLLYDQSGTLVGSGSTIIKTFVANEERAFVVDWPFAVPGAVRAQAFVSTNLFANDNYIRAYGSQERFQGY